MEQSFVQYGIAGAVLVVVAMFLLHLKGEREDRKIERLSFVATVEKLGASVEASADVNRQATEASVNSHQEANQKLCDSVHKLAVQCERSRKNAATKKAAK